MKDEMKKAIVKAISEKCDADDSIIQTYANYCQSMKNGIDRKTNLPKNPWLQTWKESIFIDAFLKVWNQGIAFDGKHVTWTKTGITYDYQAYKNKMMIAYPETTIDCELVYQGDEFRYRKENGIVTYTHIPADPFAQSIDKIKGGYILIINKRGQFMTTLNKADIDKHKSVAKTKAIWDKWYQEMAKKTLMRKGVKFHFDDVFQEMNEDDNNHFDLSQLSGKISHDEIQMLFDSYGDQLTAANHLRAKEIIESKDEKSYKKLANALRAFESKVEAESETV